MENKPKISYLGEKEEIQIPYEWIATISVGVISRKEFEEIGYAGVTPVHVVGTKDNFLFPTYRIAGETIEDIRIGLMNGIGGLIETIKKQEAKDQTKDSKDT